MVAMPDRCWTMLSALRSAVSSARARAFDPHQIGACWHLVAIARQRFDHAIGVEMAEERLSQRQAGHHDRIAAVHHAGKARALWDHAFRSHIAPAAGQPFAQVFGKSFADEFGKVETGEGELGHGQAQ